LSKNREAAPDIAKPEAGAVAVRDLLQDPDVGLDLELIQGSDGLDNGIRSHRIQKLGMTLAGFTGFIHPDRVQVFGSSELNYLHTLDSEARIAAMQRLRKHQICCVLVTKGLEVPDELLRIAGEEKISILRSIAPSAVSIEKIAAYLEKRLAPRMTIHGVLLDVLGLGVLLLGPSGIGKSECALELVLKGHRLIADDYVEIMRKGGDRLSGTGSKVLEHHMELRGLGIINIKELFGISATSVSQSIDMAVRLERWNSESDYDRLGLDRPTVEFLGVSIPLTAMPVAPGRNVSTLVEVAARIHLLRQRKPMDDLRLTNVE
jgi:HPr kinase/phosphorylase